MSDFVALALLAALLTAAALLSRFRKVGVARLSQERSLLSALVWLAGTVWCATRDRWASAFMFAVPATAMLWTYLLAGRSRRQSH